MSHMFNGCKNFNSDLSKWDVSNVEHMMYMFYNCKNFKSNLSKWDVSKVEDFDCMFYNCKKVNINRSKWRPEYPDKMFSEYGGPINDSFRQVYG